jgi:hypothetical protein
MQQPNSSTEGLTVMFVSIPDLVPSPAAPSRRGGRRPGAGAKPGHLNALKHGRRSSRFRDSLPVAPLDPAAVAVRVLRQKQRAVESIAASVLRGILDARHRRDLAAAVKRGDPLPQPSLLANTDADLLRVHRYLAGLTAQAQLERAHAAGRIRPDNPVLQDAARFANRIEQITPIVATALDRASRTPLTADTVAALLALPPSHQQNDQPHQTHTSRPTNPGKPRKKKTNDHLLPLSQHWERGSGGEGH